MAARREAHSMSSHCSVWPSSASSSSPPSCLVAVAYVVGMAGNEARSFHKATRTIQHTAFDVATPRFFRLESELVQLHAVDVLVPE